MMKPPGGDVVVYEIPDGAVRVDVRLERETLWLSQRRMREIFDTSTDNVGLHLKNIFSEGELDEAATTEDYSVVQTESHRQVRREVRHYNLDAIISVGYWVNSKLLFLDHLPRNGLLLRNDSGPRLADNAMAALALLIAESEPAHRSS
jgi:hypothetical protein